MYGPKWPFLLMYGSHDLRHMYSAGSRVVNGPPGFGASHLHLLRNSGYLHVSLTPTQKFWISPRVSYTHTGPFGYYLGSPSP